MKGTKNLTQGPILRQLFTLAMPIMATSFIQMAYSLTDMAWVGRLGSEAIAAVGSVGILTWMSTAIALLNKVGAEVNVGQAIGAQDEQAARNFASNNITLALLISVLWGAILFIFARPIISIYELQHTSKTWQWNICASYLQHCRSYSCPLLLPEHSMQQEGVRFLSQSTVLV